MANKYLERKWELWFNVMDVNHDGILSHRDLDKETQAFSHLHHIDTATAAVVAEKLATWWKDNVFRNHTGDITHKMFVDDLNAELLADKAKFVERMKETFNIGCQIVDVDNDGYISENEYFVLFKSLGHKDVDMMNTMFQSFKPVKGLVKNEVVADAWANFVTSDDDTVPCPIKDALEKEKK